MWAKRSVPTRIAARRRRLLLTPDAQASDPAGHTTAQAGFTYTWDGAGRLKTVRLSGHLLATYHYDARHRRTRKETTAQAPQGVATVLYTYDDNDHLIAETDSTGPIRSYVWRDDVPLAQIEHRPTRKVLYLETDHLNTPRAARNEAGVLVWRWASDAFGSSLPNEDPDGDGQATTVNLRLPGQVFDPESGLHYNQARYYDPTIGRYLSPDPIGLAGGVNTYAHVENNPLRYVDPSGELLFLPFAFAAAGGLTAADVLLTGGGLVVAGAAIYSATQHLPDVTATDVARPDSCDDDPCPPCKTTSGKIVPVGTIGYRPLDTPSKPQHGIAGPHCDETTPNKGPIPRGRYTARSRDLSNPPWFKDIARNLPGLGADWGDWRVRLRPSPETETFGRSGFFLHGGPIRGSAGCIDAGGGVFGSKLTDQLLQDIMSDPDGKIPVNVE